jgi:hypothetical protein
MLLCLKCFKVYNQKTIKNDMCKVKGCHGDVVEIDELFIPLITELNKKGYKTNYCCSGHIDSISNSYIYFKDEIILPSLPNGYLYDQDMYPHVDWSRWKVKNTIRRQFNVNKSLNELSKDIYRNAIEVLEWAEELPDCIIT